jgi:hypothetical protein
LAGSFQKLHIPLLRELIESFRLRVYKHSAPTGLRSETFRTSGGKAASVHQVAGLRDPVTISLIVFGLLQNALRVFLQRSR